jgi:hypothetical protein
MAFDDPIVWIILVFEILIPVVIIYMLYKLAQFLIKANKFMDQQMKKDQEKEPQKTAS